MMPAEPIFRHCPACRKLLVKHTLMSGNTIGARFWTDGKMKAPMLPQYPALVRCAHCRELLWLPDAEKFTPDPPLEMFEIAEGAEKPLDPTEQDFLEAIKRGFAKDGDEEKYLRVQAWHSFNDKQREADAPPLPFSDVAAANMEALYQMLDEEDADERLMKAELARELGRFADAVQLLEYDFAENLTTAADLIRQLASQGQTRVAEIKQSSESGS